MGPWGDFSVSRASAFTVDARSVLVLAIMWMQGFWIMLGCLPVDIYPSFFSLTPVGLFSPTNRWYQLTEDVLCRPQWMAVYEGPGWKSQSSVTSGHTGDLWCAGNAAGSPSEPARLQLQPSQMQGQSKKMGLLSDPAPDAQWCTVDPSVRWL